MNAKFPAHLENADLLSVFDAFVIAPNADTFRAAWQTARAAGRTYRPDARFPDLAHVTRTLNAAYEEFAI